MTGYMFPHEKRFTMNETTRAYIYRVIVAAIPLLVLVGVGVDSQTAENILTFAAAVLGLGASGLAVGNTSTKG